MKFINPVTIHIAKLLYDENILHTNNFGVNPIKSKTEIKKLLKVDKEILSYENKDNFVFIKSSNYNFTRFLLIGKVNGIFFKHYDQSLTSNI